MDIVDALSLGFSAFALAIALASALFARSQVRLYSRQLKLGVIVEMIAMNRALVSLGFSDPDLFDALDGQRIASPARARRYMQLWLNQAAFMYQALRMETLDDTFWPAVQKDIELLVSNPNMQEHWRAVCQYYDPAFRSVVEEAIRTSATDNSPKEENLR